MNLNEYLEQLRSLDVNNPGAWPRWAQVGGILLLCGLVAFFGYRLLIKPKLEELDRARQEEVKLRNEFETKQKKVANLDAYKRQLDEMQQSFGAMLKQLPSKSEVANLLNDISQTRVASGLEEELFQPQGEQTKDFYAELPISLQVIGGYHQMGSFVSSIAALPRIVTISDVTIKAEGTAASQAAQTTRATVAGAAAVAPLNRLRITMVAKTYRYLDAEEQAAADAQKAQAGAKK